MEMVRKACRQCGAEFMPWSADSAFCSQSCVGSWYGSRQPNCHTGTFADIESRSQLQPDGCRVWTKAIGTSGYGNIGVAGRSLMAHRYAYQIVNGPIPDGMVVDHLCRNRACVNPEHMELVTPRENAERGLKGRLGTHCKNGHERNEANTYLFRNARMCRRCGVIRSREYLSRKRAALAKASPSARLLECGE